LARLAGFKYREIVKKLKKHGFEFYRQASGSHEIWYNKSTNLYTTIPNHSGDMPENTKTSKHFSRRISLKIKKQ